MEKLEAETEPKSRRKRGEFVSPHNDMAGRMEAMKSQLGAKQTDDTGARRSIPALAALEHVKYS